MTTTPPDPQGTGPGEPADEQAGPSTTTTGPRVDAGGMRDVSRLRRTTGPWRRVGGVAGGLGRHFDVDPLLIRVAFVVLTFFGGAGLVLYVGCWLLLPEDGADRAPLQLDLKAREIGLVILAALGVVLVLGGTFGDGMGWPLALAAVVVGIVLLAKRSDDGPQVQHPGTAPWLAPTDPAAGAPPGPPADTSMMAAQGALTADGPPAPPSAPFDPGYADPVPPAYTPQPDPRKRGPKLFWPTLATIVLGWGVLGMVDVTGTELPFAAYPALAVAVAGLALLLSAVWGRGGGLIALGLVGVLGLGVSTIADVVTHDPVVVAPTTGVVDRYSHSAGDYTLDLTQVDPELLDGRMIRVESGAGRLVVIVPDGVAVDVEARVGAGDVTVFGQRHGGAGISMSQGEGADAGAPHFSLDAQLGVGEMEIIKEGDQR